MSRLRVLKLLIEKNQTVICCYVHRRERRAVVSDEPQLLVETYLDADGFPKQSLAPMSLHRRRVLYGYCCLK